MSQNHHIVQEAYLRQWAKNGQLNIYSIPENKIKERGPNWPGFRRKDYNVLNSEQGYDYFPEQITAHVDTEGLKAICNIKINQSSLKGYEKSCIATYYALQYLRVPRRREELNKLANSVFKNLFKENFKRSISDDFDIEKMLSEEENDYIKEKMRQQINGKPLEEIKKEIIEMVDNENFCLEINNAGHSKQLIKLLSNTAKNLFYFKWNFLFSPKESSFFTSDNPCFVKSDAKSGSGILADSSKSYFPLRPDVCLVIESSRQQNNIENIVMLNKKEVREINSLIIESSYNCVVAKEKIHLQSLISRFDFSLHKKSKDILVSRDGDYVRFSLE